MGKPGETAGLGASGVAIAPTGTQRGGHHGPLGCRPPEPPARLQGQEGRGQITLSWDPVPGAIGYLIRRGPSPAGPFSVVDTKGGDVLAVPHPPLADTTPGAGGWYTVQSLACLDHPAGMPSAPAGPWQPSEEGSARVAVEVGVEEEMGRLQRPWRPMVGADHLRQLTRLAGPGGSSPAEELRDALRLARRLLGIRAVRAHGILTDDPQLYTEGDRGPVLDLRWVTSVYDQLRQLGVAPVVELSFVPQALAAEGSPRVFRYQAPVAPPRDLRRWGQLVEGFVRHLVARYGRRQVRTWFFEVWNEPNLAVFWPASQEEYFRLYETTAQAIKDVDPRLRVGGPASAAAGWLHPFLDFASQPGIPLDFLSTHTYGNLPLDLRPLTERSGRPGLPLLWTEWGVTPTHFHPVNDLVFGAPFILHGMKSAMGRLAALSYWVISDHFEELGEPNALFHGGFGLLTVGNLRKPRFWALALLERLGPIRLATSVEGDGAQSLVDALATRDVDGTLRILIWNGTLDQTRAEGDPVLRRTVELAIPNLAVGRYRFRHLRIDEEHSNIRRVWQELGGPPWPGPADWNRLRASDRLEEAEPSRLIRLARPGFRLEVDLPMPAVSYIELRRA
jgi:xylan 1,4-beta-xylosidase